MANFVLVPGPMVGAEVMRPTAEALRERGHTAQVPDVWRAADDFPAWREWPKRVAAEIKGDGPLIIVGHSASTIVAAALSKMGNVAATIMLDGFIPPQDGPMAPADGALLDLIQTLPSESGVLAPWDEWWQTPANRETVGVTALEAAPELHREFMSGLPRLPANWFDDVIRLPNWRGKPAGYIQTSKYFEYSAIVAERLGWPLERLAGTHLHPMLAPEETANAIEAILEAFVRADAKFDASCDSLSARII